MGLFELIQALQSGDKEARVAAALDLHEYPSDSTVEALSQALGDDSSEVRSMAAESLRVIAVRGECTIPGEPLLEVLRRDPELYELKSCLRYLGYEDEVERIVSRGVSEYSVRCMPFRCPHCMEEITRVPSWPTRGDKVAFYAQTDLDRPGAFHVKLKCGSCREALYVVWDEDPS
jgi:hypothetical protein